MEEKSILSRIYQSFPGFRNWPELIEGYDIDNLGLILVALAKYSKVLLEKKELEELSKIVKMINSFVSSEDKDLKNLTVTCYFEGSLEYENLLSFLEKELNNVGRDALREVRSATNATWKIDSV